MPTDLLELERDAVLLNRQLRTMRRPLTSEERAQVNERAARIRQGIADVTFDRLVTNRPEVVSRGRPVSGQAAKRGLEEARARLEQKPEFKRACSACPAAQVSRHISGGVKIECQVEGTTLTSAEDPQSVLTFCMGDYKACPSWQVEKEAIAAGRKLTVVG